MNWIERAKKKGVSGFSLLELMVVVAILGVLAMVAIPRYNMFRARSRQAEAKTNLGVIFTLQEAFKIEREQFFDGKKDTWGGEDMYTKTANDNADGAGYITKGGTHKCGRNMLGFRMANCAQARYAYLVGQADEDEFLVIAHAYSDRTQQRIFPGCDGTEGATGNALKKKPTDGVGTIVKCARDGTNTERV